MNYEQWLDAFIKDSKIDTTKVLYQDITCGQFLEGTKKIKGWQKDIKDYLLYNQYINETEKYLEYLCEKAVLAGYQF